MLCIGSMITEPPTSQLRELYDQWFASIPAKDASFVDRHMHPELRMILPDGTQLDASAYKQMYAALPPGSRFDYRISEFVVRPLGAGAAALITGVYHSHIQHEGVSISDKAVRFISVWESAPSGWRLLVHQLTALPSG